MGLSGFEPESLAIYNALTQLREAQEQNPKPEG